MLAQAQPTIHALIDVGAVVMGPTNQEVVEFMLREGLPWAEAGVFIDMDGRRMVVFRGGSVAVPLNTVGLPWHKRFTFYDQMHTTGMDIKQSASARAAITVGKVTLLRTWPI